MPYAGRHQGTRFFIFKMPYAGRHQEVVACPTTPWTPNDTSSLLDPSSARMHDTAGRLKAGGAGQATRYRN